jgi:hypothetical protein
MNMLDETFTPMNWQREHTTIDGNLYCTIKVWDGDKKEWVAKQDVGIESQTEKTKGEASDAFKRAGFNWGIGRELYTSPFIFVQLNENEWKIGNSGKKQTKPSFGLSVKEIDYTNNREIKTLVLIDNSGRERFSFGKGKARNDVPTEEPAPVKPPVTPAKVTYACPPSEFDRRRNEVVKITKEKGKTSDDYNSAKEQIDTRSLKEMTTPEYDAFLLKLTDALK